MPCSRYLALRNDLRRARALLFSCAALCCACGTQRASSRAQATPASVPTANTSAAQDTPAQSASSAPPAPPPAIASSAEAAPRVALPWSFTRARSEPVDSIAVGAQGRLALLAGSHATLFERGAFRELPDVPLPPSAEVAIWFGRDNAPRVMGFARDASAPEQQKSIYLRFKGGRWQPEPSELGPLGSSKGALYGVLGFADPEVVCRPGAVCLIKRLSGWKSVPAHPAPQHVLLSGGSAWALGEDSVERLDERGFTPLTPTRAWRHPSSLWTNGADVFVSELEPARLHRLRGGEWQSFEVPLRGPRASWGDERGLWLAGDGGAALFDGASFQLASELSGPLHAIVANGDELWFAGGAGAFRAVRN